MSNKYLEKIAGIASKIGNFAKKVTGENVRNLRHHLDGVEDLAGKVHTTSNIEAHTALNAKSKLTRVLSENARHKSVAENVDSNVNKIYQEGRAKLDKAVADRNSARLVAGSTAAATGAAGLGVSAKKYLDKKNDK